MQIGTQSENILQTEFPLVSRWADDLRPVLAFSADVNLALQNGEVDRLAGMGYPADLLDIMQVLLALPRVMVSTSHATEVDLYKNSSFVLLRILQKMLGDEGFEPSDVLVNYFDTVPVHVSTRSPLQFGGSAQIGTDIDLFGFAGKAHETIVMDAGMIKAALDRFAEKLPGFADRLQNQLGEELAKLIKQDDFWLSYYKSQSREAVRNLLLQRLERIVAIGNMALSQVGAEVSIAEYMMVFDQLLAGEIFTQSSAVRGYEQKFGFTSELFSQNEEYLRVIKQGIAMLVARRGMEVVKAIAKPGESLLIIRAGRRSNISFVSVNENGAFVLRNGNESQILSDEEFLEMVMSPDTLPTGKLESLVLCLAPRTLHMGSEYGIRETILSVLGVTGDAFAMQMRSRIGGDKEAGNEGIMVADAYLNLVLAYVLLGSDGIRKLLGSVIGKTASPGRFDMKSVTTLIDGVRVQTPGFKAYIAQLLVDQILPIVQKEVREASWNPT